MNAQRTLAMMVGYYLSRFDNEGVRNLGYKTQSEAFAEVSRRLEVKRNTLKNWRDEFDPIHHFRKGWYQRPMSPSRLRVVEALQGSDEETIRQICLEILNNKSFEDSVDAKNLVTIVSATKRPKKDYPFILRSPTGRKAEEFFIAWFAASSGKPFDGELLDARELGGGYDFGVRNSLTTNYVEVKGLAGDTGGVLFTNKEWLTALQQQDNYYLAIVRSIESKPTISVVRNPAVRLVAKKRISTTIQVNWSVDVTSIPR